MPGVPPLSDTADLRSGPEINPALLEVLPLVGEWSGHGSGVKPATGEQFQYAQRIAFHHDGRPFLGYQSHTWLLAADGSVLRAAFRESGFLRPGIGEDALELVLASAAGLVEVFTGLAADRRWEFATSAIGFTASAKEVSGERRLYALTRNNELGYVAELAMQPGDYQPHLNAVLTRQ